MKKLFNIFIQTELFILKHSILIPLKIGQIFLLDYIGVLLIILYYIIMISAPYPLSFFMAILILDILGIAITCTILSKFDFTRKHLKNLIGAENFSKYIGDNPGSLTTKLAVRLVTTAVALSVSKIGVDSLQDYSNSLSANRYANDCMRHGISVDPTQFNTFYQRDVTKTIYDSIIKK